VCAAQSRVASRHVGRRPCRVRPMDGYWKVARAPRPSGACARRRGSNRRDVASLLGRLPCAEPRTRKPGHSWQELRAPIRFEFDPPSKRPTGDGCIAWTGVADGDAGAQREYRPRPIRQPPAGRRLVSGHAMRKPQSTLSAC
jgi:hypothetical protein